MAREYYHVYHSYLEALEALGDAECGRLFKACLQYSKTGEVPELCGNERILFPSWKSQIDRDNQKYDAKCEKNRSNGSLGGKQTVANGSERPPNAPQGKGKGKGKGKGERKGKGDDTLTGINMDILTDIQCAQEWADFVSMRKRIKKPMVDRAVKMALSELEKLAPGDIETQKRILNQSTYRCWAGLFALKNAPAASQQREDDSEPRLVCHDEPLAVVRPEVRPDMSQAEFEQLLGVDFGDSP